MEERVKLGAVVAGSFVASGLIYSTFSYVIVTRRVCRVLEDSYMSTACPEGYLEAIAMNFLNPSSLFLVFSLTVATLSGFIYSRRKTILEILGR